MGTLSPSQMFDHTLVVVKGPSYLNRLDFSIAPKAAEDIRPGAVCSIDSTPELIAGCPVGAAGNRPMPMFAIQDVNSFDANSDVGNMSGGIMSCVVATGGFEVETTEYFTTSSYAANDLLKAGTVGDVGLVDLAGASPYAAVPVVGCVSRGTSTNRDGIGILTFWTLFLPAGS